MDVDGGNGGYAVVALGNTAADEKQPSMFYGPPSIELWENRTYCFQFNMQFQVGNTCSFGQSEFHVDPFSISNEISRRMTSSLSRRWSLRMEKRLSNLG